MEEEDRRGLDWELKEWSGKEGVELSMVKDRGWLEKNCL